MKQEEEHQVVKQAVIVQTADTVVQETENHIQNVPSTPSVSVPAKELESVQPTEQGEFTQPIKSEEESVEPEPPVENEQVVTKSETVQPKPAEPETVKEPAKPVYSPKSNANIATIDAFLPEENSEPRSTPITHIVIHFTSNAVNNPKSPYGVQEIRRIFVDYGVSAHYMIGRNGEIYDLVPENRVAYHAGKGNLPSFPQYMNTLNQYSIGIELLAIGTKEEMRTMMTDTVYESIHQSEIGYTEAQYQSLTRLIGDIVSRNPSVSKDRLHIVGHDEYAPGRKTDPGSLFHWTKIGL